MPDKPTLEPDPVTTKSLSVPLMVSTLILSLSLVWALYDEVYTMRPWKGFQSDFLELYSAHLGKLKPQQAGLEKQIKESPEYQDLQKQLDEAEAAARERSAEIDRLVRQGVTPRMIAARQTFQILRTEANAQIYLLETAGNDAAKESLRQNIEEIKQRGVEVNLVLADGSGGAETVTMNYAQLEQEYLGLQRRRVELQKERAEVLAPASGLRATRDALLAERLRGLTARQIEGLISKTDSFQIEIKQIHLNDIDLVDRCQSCHLGILEPLEIKAADVGGRAEFVSHPVPDLLKIHDPEQFGCTSCHNGNGRATRSAVKGHGRYKFWLWPMYEKENTQAGCQQCHAREIITDYAGVLNKGRTLFLNKGCWGCHRFEGFDKETEELAAVRQSMIILNNERTTNEKEQRESIELGDQAPDPDESDRLYARAGFLHLRNSVIDAELDALKIEETSLVREVRKFGPNLKEIKVKARKEWVPVWISNPHAFRPGAKMPEFRLQEDEVQKIAAYIWQNAIDGTLVQHPPGNAERGKELFEIRGCMGCHSMGEGDEKQGSSFAANLTRVGEKTTYNFLVRWIHDPSELTPDPDADPDQPRLIPLMPNLRLSLAESRDIASYLAARKTDAAYPPADFMDDPELAKEGMTLIRHYGCTGCHEIRGLETEGRIGTELTVEGSKPVERLDFALLTHPAEREGWYNHKGFFEHKLADPAVFDQGKVRPHLEKLRMPNFHLSEGDITALTTFLLGAVDTTFPEHYRYEPEDERRAVQEGWWIARRYNCIGCHQISLTGSTALMRIPRYQDPDWQEQLPPQLFTEGARVQPDWLVGFLNNPALSETDIHRNGIRQYLHARMPTFNFTERQVMKLTTFFAAKSSQPVAYIPKELEPLTPRELTLARQLFSGRAAPCLKCHMTGDPAHDRTATAPNFLTAASRLKPDWTYRWLLEPAKLAPGTAMPSELFRQEGDRWIFAGPLPASFDGYEKDHARLLVRYMFQMTPAEVRRLGVAGQ